MKIFILSLVLALIPSLISAQTARVQIIHNSADAGASVVDVYINGVLTYDNVAFRTATAFFPAPAGVNLQVDIAPGNSTSVMNSIATFNYNLTANETYVLVAEGILPGSTGYSPSTGAAAFDIAVYAQGQESAAMMGNTDVLIHHGATDAPAVDVVEVGVNNPGATILSNAAYGAFSGYIPLATDDYRLEVRAAGATAAVASFEAPLSTLGLQGASIVAIASGFLDPSVNNNGPAFGIWVALPTGGALVQLPESQARVQAIHNSADAVASVVDVYLDDNLLINDFTFRTASPFVDVPAGREVTLAIAPQNSTSSASAIATFNYTLAAEETYVLVAEGIVPGSTGYNPSTGAAAFDIAVYAQGQESAAMMGNTDVLIHHGATDAPAVDVVEVGVNNPGATILSNAAYGAFSGYIPLATDDYRLEVRATGATAAVASYEAPLATLGLQGASIVAIASGFLDPSVNNNGPAFGLWVALPAGGPLVQLQESQARVQAIHNSADAGAATVDVYLDGNLLLNDFAFRTASPFVDVPAGKEITLAIAPPNSTSAASAIATYNYTLAAEETYVLVAEGILPGSTGYNPSTGAAAFDIAVYAQGQVSAAMMGNTDVLIHHGATDAPAVDVVEVGVNNPAATILSNAAYGAFSGYIPLATDDYRLEVRATGATAAVASYEAPLATLGLQGAAIVAIASGFLDPSVNNNGPAFGLWVALPAGGPLVQLQESQARVQAIHNSADAGAATVDVYLDGAMLINDFAFRTASPFVDVPAGKEITLAIAPPNSTSVASAIATYNYTLAADETYILVAEGILPGSTGYNPSTGAAAFDIAVFAQGREAANNATEIDVLVHHGSTDAPMVDVRGADTATILVDDAVYGDFAGYLSLMDQDYVIRVTNSAGTAVVESYQANLNTLGLAGQAITVVASGFLDPSVNNNGPAFGLWVALPAGGALVELPKVSTNILRIPTAIEGVSARVLGNPINNGALALDVASSKDLEVDVDIINLQGQVLSSRANVVLIKGQTVIEQNVTNFAAGNYFVRLSTNNAQLTIPVTVQ